MNFLSAENLGKNYGERVLFTALNFGIEKGEKAALIAANGTGKSTLLRILAGKDDPDEGMVALHKGIQAGYLEQEPEFDPELTISQLIRQGDMKVRKVTRDYENALKRHAENPGAETAKTLAITTAKMDQSGGWDYERRLVEMLDRFGINFPDQKIGTLSGGQKKRLALALLLMDNPDLMLLDEPTNHLDIEMIEWLENYLSNSSVTFLMVTHDRYFLDRICNRILEIDNRDLYSYRGNYEFFLEKKAEREASIAAGKEKADKYVKQELEWIRRMPKARGTKSKSRIDAFNRAREKAAVRKSGDSLKLDIKMKRVGGKILDIRNLTKNYGEQTILSGFSYRFSKGEKVGIIGPNGSGKSTFLDLITGRKKPDQGTIDTGETIQYGYFTQEGMKVDKSKRVIDIVTDIAEIIETGNGSKMTASQFLQYFLFPPETQYDYVSKLSGGEKRRLFLLTVLIKDPNFLILDEPTNDLDILTLSRLEDFLSSFRGCMILVSHDRYMLDRLVDHLFIFGGNGRIIDYYGSYQDYKFEKEASEEEAKRTSRSKEDKPLSRSATGSNNIRIGKQSYKEKIEYEKLEKEIAALEEEKKALETFLNSGENDYEKLEKASARIGDLLEMIDEKTLRWLELDELKDG